MATYVLANSINLNGTILPAGKVIDTNVYDIVVLQLAGAVLVPMSPAVAAQANALLRQRQRGQSMPLDVGGVINSVSPLIDGGGAPEELATYAVSGAMTALDLVRLSASGQVARASAAAITSVPAIGAVVVLPTPSSAQVQSEGELAGFAGLVAGSTYYLSTSPGQISAIAPSVQGQVVQKVGIARDATTLILMIDQDFVLL